MKKILVTICSIVITSFITVSGPSAGQVMRGATKAPVFTGRQYTKYARINLDAARNIARTAFPGIIVSEELERERGGSGLRYSFDIRKNGITHEVGVDAVTGKVLENTLEGPLTD
jgi:Peptidase propeptide and YPEB domain